MKEVLRANTRLLLLSVLILGSAVIETEGYYHPDQGRWLSRDPIGERGGLHLYRYVRNSPIDAIDPTGLYVAAPIDLAVFLFLDFFELKFYSKWRDPSALEPPYEELKSRVAATQTYAAAKARLGAKLQRPCTPGDYGYDPEPVTYTEATVKNVLHKADLVQYWECDNACKRTRKKLETMDVYDFAGSYSYYFPFEALEWVGLGHPYRIVLTHERTR